jgi:signal transduction histidine kinase
MGLAICRRIVERHGGEIAALSETGHGTTVVVTLPSIQEM